MPPVSCHRKMHLLDNSQLHQLMQISLHNLLVLELSSQCIKMKIFPTFSSLASNTPKKKSKPGESSSETSQSSTRRTPVTSTITFSPYSSRTAGTVKTTFLNSKTSPTSSKIAQVSRCAPSLGCCRHAISSPASLSGSSIRPSTFVIRQSHSTHPNPTSCMSFWDMHRCLPTQRSHNSRRK